MSKFSRSMLFLGAACFLSPVAGAAEKMPIAGEMTSKSSFSPYVEFDPHPSITGFMTPRPIEHDDEDIYFSANEIQNDNNTDVITALGDVYIIRSDATLKADKVTYNQKLDVITASGNVSLVDQDNNVMFADEMVLQDKMSKGTISKLKVVMRDESRIWADRVKTLKNDDKVMYNAVYTPCDCCSMKGKDQEPLWKITADKIRQDVANKNVYYKNAVLKVKDVPVFYTPFLSHPDPSVKRRSGFLMPTYGSSGYLDTYIRPGYFWAIDDQSDLTFSPYLSLKRGVVPFATYRAYSDKGELTVQGSVLKDNDDDKTRGNLFVKSRYEIDENWLATLDAKYVSDTLFLKDLSLPEKTDAWLTSNVKFEYFDSRDYAAIESYYFKMISYDLRTTQLRDKYDASYVLPLLDYEKYDQLTDSGLYTRNVFNFASVVHDDDTASTQRGTMINEVVLPYTSRFGEKIRLVGSVKSDFYYVDDYLNADNQYFTGTAARVFPQLGAEWKLPFIKANDESRQILEPVVVAVAAPNDSNKIDKIPNEDSQNAYLDDTNVLDLDRYSGYDRNDTGSRISYGLNWSSYGNILGRTQAFVAQSYYFNEEESFSESMGNKSHLSDYVGRIYANPSDFLDLNYRFRLDKDDMDIRYSELAASVGPRMLKTYVSYIYLNDKDYAESYNKESERHELYTSVTAQLTRDWSVKVYNRQDLSSGKSYSLEHGGSLIYEDECISLTGNIQRYDSNDPDVENDYEFSISFLLKTIGGVGSK